MYFVLAIDKLTDVFSVTLIVKNTLSLCENNIEK